jgi:hypothetical protein
VAGLAESLSAVELGSQAPSERSVSVVSSESPDEARFPCKWLKARRPQVPFEDLTLVSRRIGDSVLWMYTTEPEQGDPAPSARSISVASSESPDEARYLCKWLKARRPQIPFEALTLVPRQIGNSVLWMYTTDP